MTLDPNALAVFTLHLSPDELRAALREVRVEWPQIWLGVEDAPIARLQVSLHVPDRDTGEPKTFWGSFDGWRRGEFAERLMDVMVYLVHHELDENLYLDGVRAWDPHDLRGVFGWPLVGGPGSHIAAVARDDRGARDVLARLDPRWPVGTTVGVERGHLTATVRGLTMVSPVDYPCAGEYLANAARGLLRRVARDAATHALTLPDRPW